MRATKDWKLVRGSWISPEASLPGVWQRKDGGYVVRARVKEHATGKTREIWKVLVSADAPTALKWLSEERARVRDGVAASAKSLSVRFSEFAASHFEHKVTVGEIRSAAGRNKWHYTLKHLIAAFGDHYLDRLHVSHVEKWRAEQAARVNAGELAPTTVNGWLAVLRVLMKAARHHYHLAHDALEGVRDLDTSEHEIYTEEEPNSFLPDEIGRFVAKFKQMYPQHFAMLYLGLLTGLRPSTLRPLRRRGPEADVQWDEGRLRVRRSHTFGDEVMRTTKQKRRYTIDLPPEAIEVLRWHVATQFSTPEQKQSDLLFPSVTGGFRTQKVLNGPMAEVAAEVGIGKHVTQKALRRTFNDLARAAQVSDLVTRSISGHLTDQMQRHYSTVNAVEQRGALAKVVRLFDAASNKTPSTAVRGGEGGGEGRPASGEESKTG